MQNKQKCQALTDFERFALSEITRLCNEREKYFRAKDKNGFGATHFEIRKLKEQLRGHNALV